MKCIVLKASGPVFESSHKHRLRFSVSTQIYHTSYIKTALVNKRKPIDINEKFIFDIGMPTDFLMCLCVNSKDEAQGTLTIALSHLPADLLVCKWYELKSKHEDIAHGVIQLRLKYHLSYSIHRRDESSSLTIVPSQSAKEYIRKQCKYFLCLYFSFSLYTNIHSLYVYFYIMCIYIVLAYARTNKTCYRFVEYFLVLGMSFPQCQFISLSSFVSIVHVHIYIYCYNISIHLMCIMNGLQLHIIIHLLFLNDIHLQITLTSQFPIVSLQYVLCL